MAEYHLHVKAMSRSKGQSATAAAAYRSASRVRDERTGELHDYSRKRGLVYRDIVAPTAAPTWARDRERLWNAAEAAEGRKNSTIAREFQLGLPHELTAPQRLELTRCFAEEIVERHQVVVDIAIHTPHRGGDPRNHHAHLLCTTRRMSAEGLTQKSRELDDKKTGEVEYWRDRWEKMQNEHLAAYGYTARVSCRSLKEQGISREPTRHKGPAVTAIERREQWVRVSERQQQEVNERLRIAYELGRTQLEAALVQRSIIDLSTSIEIAKRQRELSPATYDDLAHRRQLAREEWAAFRETQQAARQSSSGREIVYSPHSDRQQAQETDRDTGLSLDQ